MILSDKYLKSPNCMYELMEVWRNCKLESEALRERIRVFRTTDAAMIRPSSGLDMRNTGGISSASWTPLCTRTRACGQGRFALPIDQEFATTWKSPGPDRQHVLPKDLDELDKYGLDDGSITTPPSG